MSVTQFYGEFYCPANPQKYLPGFLTIDTEGPIDLRIIADTTNINGIMGGGGFDISLDSASRIVGHLNYNISSDAPQTELVTLDGCRAYMTNNLGGIGFACEYFAFHPSVLYIGHLEESEDDIPIESMSFSILDTNRWFSELKLDGPWRSARWEMYVKHIGNIKISQPEWQRTEIKLHFDGEKNTDAVRRTIQDIQELLSVAQGRYHPVVNVKINEIRPHPKLFFHHRKIVDFVNPTALNFPNHPNNNAGPIFTFEEIDKHVGLIKWLEYREKNRREDTSIDDMMLEKLLKSHLWSPLDSISDCDQVITCLLSVVPTGANIETRISKTLENIAGCLPGSINTDWAKAIALIRNKFTSHPEELRGFIPPSKELYIARKHAYQVCISHICKKVLNVPDELILERLWQEQDTSPTITDREFNFLKKWVDNYLVYAQQVSSKRASFG